MSTSFTENEKVIGRRHRVKAETDHAPDSVYADTCSGPSDVAVVCLPGDGYRAFAVTCPRETASLGGGKAEKVWTAEGVGNLRASEEWCVVVCPWHNSDLDTGLSPYEPGRLRIKTCRVQSEGGEVVVYV